MSWPGQRKGWDKTPEIVGDVCNQIVRNIYVHKSGAIVRVAGARYVAEMNGTVIATSHTRRNAMKAVEDRIAKSETRR